MDDAPCVYGTHAGHGVMWTDGRRTRSCCTGCCRHSNSNAAERISLAGDVLPAPMCPEGEDEGEVEHLSARPRPRSL